MPPIRPPDDPWTELTGADIDDWTGARIADRGRAYQRDGHVSELARLADGSLIAWVDGTERYVTHVFLEDNSVPLSLCTCPYGENCKHAVGLVVDYQKRVRKKQRIPQAVAEDIRLRLLDEDFEAEMSLMTEDAHRDIDRFLKGATKTELVALVRQLSVQFPQVARALSDRQQLVSGNANALVARLRKEILAMAGRPGWQNYWNNEGFTPDFSAIRRKLGTLLEARRYRDAERWIHEGLKTTDDQLQGRASGLRDKLLEIRRREKDWPAVAAILVEEFIRRPSLQGFTECRKGSGKVKVWSEVRRRLLDYLENGQLPWDRNKWPLPETGLEKPEIDPRRRHPMLRQLIAIAIAEKKPAGVLKWYDRCAPEPYPGHGIDDDAVAVAVQTYAPERSVEIWQAVAEGLIAVVKPSAYKAAAQYLRKAERVVQRLKKEEAWQQYLQALRQQHFRKRRLLEILDEFD